MRCLREERRARLPFPAARLELEKASDQIGILEITVQSDFELAKGLQLAATATVRPPRLGGQGRDPVAIVQGVGQRRPLELMAYPPATTALVESLPQQQPRL